MEQIFSLIISLSATIISSMAVFFFKRYFKLREERERVREQLAAEENMLILRSINAIGKLTLANSIALRDGRTNGEMASAMREYEKVDGELYDFLLRANFTSRQSPKA